MGGLIGDVHLPIILDELKTLMEAITSNYGSFNNTLQVI